jgi:uncharacterized protein
MRKGLPFQLVLAVLLALSGPFARADLYSAAQAFKNQEYEKAFQLFLELAELGQRDAQANVAMMYVEGTGVKRNNVLGLAWAKIAAENGATEVQHIIEQLTPHVTPAAQKRIDEVYSLYGPLALKKRVLPSIFDRATSGDYQPCKLIPGQRVSHYPMSALEKGIEGGVYVEFTVMPDGRARNPRIVYSVPVEVFDTAARSTVFRTEFQPASTKGVPEPCTMALMVRYTINAGDKSYTELMKYVEKTKTQADAGDARSQLMYGVLTEGLPQLAKSRNEAMPSILKAAQAGLPTAQYMVGYRALQGWGCECDEPKALMWLHKAAAADQSDAQVVLAHYLLRGDPNLENTDKALTWLERAAKANHRDGKFYLAAVLAAGADAGKRDPARALQLLEGVMNDLDDDPTSYEIRAAANAMLGKFDQARKDQSRALKMAQKLGWENASLNARMTAYNKNQPWTGDLFAF